jgi:YegS/Rv2252/BmrU family lipid kinase
MGVELLINTASRRGKDAADDVIAAVKTAGITPTTIHRLNNPARLHTLLAAIKQRQPSLLIVGSGDGTISDVVDELVGTKIELAVIPLGTTNNFARSLHIPLDIPGAAKMAATSPARAIDLGIVNGDYFSNVAGIGISAEVAATIPNGLKKRYGRLAYAIHGCKLLLKHRPFHAVISDKHNKLTLNVKTHQLIVANGKYHAGTQITADTSVESRELVIFKLGGTSRLSFVWHMIDFYLGQRKSVAHTSYLVAKDVSVTTDRPISIELDGEVKERTPANVQIKPRVILVRH